MNRIPYRLPLEPVIPWFKECIERDTLEAFSMRIGMSSRRLSEMVNGKSRYISFNKLDKLLAKEGGRSIIDFYPEYIEENFAETFNSLVKEPIVEKRTDAEGNHICGLCDEPHHARGLCREHYREMY